jgi:membrane protein YqaA with SNARE-associated domain
MEIWKQLNDVGPYAWCLSLSIVSALVPWVNGEVILLSLTAVARSPWARLLLVLSASAGQMAGKCVLYWAGKGVIRFEQSPARMLSLVFVSSAVGIPPFYVITILAGVLRVRFGPFFAVGACGRVVRFGALAFIPWLVLQWIR